MVRQERACRKFTRVSPWYQHLQDQAKVGDKFSAEQWSQVGPLDLYFFKGRLSDVNLVRTSSSVYLAI
jgi:hypothetical protein